MGSPSVIPADTADGPDEKRLGEFEKKARVNLQLTMERWPEIAFNTTREQA